MDLFKKKRKKKAEPTKVDKPKKSFFAKKTPTKVKQEKIAVKPKLGNKNLPVLIAVVLGLLGLAVAAKFFLFSEPEFAPTEVVSAPAVEPTPEAPAQETAAATTTDATAEAVQAEQQPVVGADNPEQAATQQLSAPVVAPQDATQAEAAESKITYEDFVQQSQTRVYRERSTDPNATTQ